MVRFYLVLTLLGILLPYGALVPWVVINGLDISLLLSEAVANPISIMAWLDVLVGAIALIGFILVDGQRYKVKYRYFAVLGTLSVGVSFGLPMYLYFKEKQSLQPQP
ncbi:DUF2834 domain-containing protein [Vibrio parahaemolyticus]|uniref:DUF2834 domain-containing protein n=1 Tax=Vibrio parahaemolyticus TaxID=670 RepID=UPI0004A3E79F|nr:DUF2834 domain-containing protein [Vibrio parahaemolyticus]EGQ9537204.1 DUF2834 domain-containing protein [Vibrio parahaemolyticus]EHZ7340110.1 DUF2834 domain-containing protein [Vibrio parahaemolyticus]EIA1329070.1 DUF2834 domain-containing protein [Vibrio parahaemolyticus]EIQ6223679.1 DUF2834 domain-containing protein [Vibrio parahaemolyticus]EJR3076256.1 DUF2834 domain-containing protein [Vibrio parahaemolyticus]